VTRSEGTLVRVDPQRRRVLARIPLAHRAAALAFGGGLVAVALQD
jgi:hypothetical protein